MLKDFRVSTVRLVLYILNSTSGIVFFSTYDGTYLRSFLNGKNAGILELLETPLKDNADIGIGGASDGSNLFKGWVDEIRYYLEPLNQEDARIAFGEGFGIWVPVPKLMHPW